MHVQSFTKFRTGLNFSSLNQQHHYYYKYKYSKKALILQTQNCNQLIYILITPIAIALSLLIAPPINPLACTKSMSCRPESYFSFTSSLIPLQAALKGNLSSNEPSFLGTPWILHFKPDFSGNTTKSISPSHLASSQIVTIGFCQGTYLSNRTILPEG